MKFFYQSKSNITFILLQIQWLCTVLNNNQTGYQRLLQIITLLRFVHLKSRHEAL